MTSDEVDSCYYGPQMTSDEVHIGHSELHKLLPHHQSAYRSSHSTETAVLAVHNDLVRTMDSGNISALVLMDLSAAFDTVDHHV